ncbi:MAG: antitoxin MazE family protein [Proteobacteria bacterium]|nr:antitoxin MazE family protein [Pseudomonadota bacterium]
MGLLAERVEKHRNKLRKAGLRPVQIWVPDARRPGFAEECRRQSLALKNDPHESEIMAWIEAATDTSEWE